MAIRAVTVAQAILQGQQVENAARELVPHVQDMLRVRNADREHPERAVKVLREFQTLWEAVGRRLIERGVASGLLFLIDPAAACAGHSSLWLLLKELNTVIDVELVTAKWDSSVYAKLPGKSDKAAAVEYLRGQISRLDDAQKKAMTTHLNAWREK